MRAFFAVRVPAACFVMPFAVPFAISIMPFAVPFAMPFVQGWLSRYRSSGRTFRAEFLWHRSCSKHARPRIAAVGVWWSSLEECWGNSWETRWHQRAVDPQHASLCRSHRADSRDRARGRLPRWMDDLWHRSCYKIHKDGNRRWSSLEECSG